MGPETNILGPMGPGLGPGYWNQTRKQTPKKVVPIV